MPATPGDALGTVLFPFIGLQEVMAYDYDRISRTGAAKPIPAYVKAGRELEQVASEFSTRAKTLAGLQQGIPNLIARIVKLKASAPNEQGLVNALDELLRNIKSHAPFVSLSSLERDAAAIARTADKLKTTIR